MAGGSIYIHTSDWFLQSLHAALGGTIQSTSSNWGRACNVREHAITRAVQPSPGHAHPPHQRIGGHDGFQVGFLSEFE